MFTHGIACKRYLRCLWNQQLEVSKTWIACPASAAPWVSLSLPRKDLARPVLAVLTITAVRPEIRDMVSFWIFFLMMHHRSHAKRASATGGLGRQIDFIKMAGMDMVGAFAQLNCPCCFRPGNPLCENPSESLTSAQKLTALRGLMLRHNIDGYLVVRTIIVFKRTHLQVPVCSHRNYVDQYWFWYFLSLLKTLMDPNTCVIVIWGVRGSVVSLVVLGLLSSLTKRLSCGRTVDIFFKQKNRSIHYPIEKDLA